MAHVIVVYESKYGQTHKVAEYCAELARGRGDSTHLVHVSSVTAADLRDADVTLVLSPIYFGRPPRSIRRFILQHRQDLMKGTSAFFTVSGAGGGKSPSERQTARTTAQGFLKSVGWKPSAVATFGGAIAYPRYNFLVRFIVKTGAKKSGGPTDTSRIHEATDWTEVEQATFGVLATSARARETNGVSAASTPPMDRGMREEHAPESRP